MMHFMVAVRFPGQVLGGRLRDAAFCSWHRDFGGQSQVRAAPSREAAAEIEEIFTFAEFEQAQQFIARTHDFFSKHNDSAKGMPFSTDFKVLGSEQRSGTVGGKL